MSFQGVAEGKFAGVKSVMEASLASGADLGASFCATKGGETVVDIWGGHTNPAKSREWERDTIINVYSTTKTMTALTALLLADRGVFDLHDEVSKFWPEFAAEMGKESGSIASGAGRSRGRSPDGDLGHQNGHQRP